MGFIPPPDLTAFADPPKTDRQALEDLVVDNPALQRLEELLAEFNLFEAIGVVRQELRHSDFLGFLMDGRQPHGLGDTFLKRAQGKFRDGIPVRMMTELRPSSGWADVSIHIADWRPSSVAEEGDNLARCLTVLHFVLTPPQSDTRFGVSNGE